MKSCPTVANLTTTMTHTIDETAASAGYAHDAFGIDFTLLHLLLLTSNTFIIVILYHLQISRGFRNG